MPPPLFIFKLKAMINNEKLKMITNIKERITSYFDTDDNRLDDDFIWEQCMLLRPIFIERAMDRLGAGAEEFLSRIELNVDDYYAEDVYETQEIDGEEVQVLIHAANIDFPGYKRSSIPKLMDHKDNIKYLGPVAIALDNEYTRVTADSFFRLSGRTWTSTKIFFIVFKDKIFYSSTPVNNATPPVALTKTAAWVLLNRITDDPSYNSATTPIVPLKYQTMLEEMVADMILKYADQGKLNRTNNATDQDAE